MSVKPSKHDVYMLCAELVDSNHKDSKDTFKQIITTVLHDCGYYEHYPQYSNYNDYCYYDYYNDLNEDYFDYKYHELCSKEQRVMIFLLLAVMNS